MADSNNNTLQEPEEWRAIPGYEGLYSISNLGRIRRDKGGVGCRAGRILVPVLTNWGYLRLSLWRNGAIRNFRVHRLVATAFLGPCPDGHEINHLDGNKLNNRADNLEYCTSKQNKQHATKLGLAAKGNNYPNAKLSDALVKELRRRHAAGESYRTLAKICSVSFTTIFFAVTGRTWKHVT